MSFKTKKQQTTMSIIPKATLGEDASGVWRRWCNSFAEEVWLVAMRGSFTRTYLPGSMFRIDQDMLRGGTVTFDADIPSYK